MSIFISPTQGTSSTQQPAIEVMEEEFYEKLDSVTEINEDVKEYVTHFLEDAYSNLKFAARFGEVGNRSSVLGLTERVGARMMGLLNNKDEEVAEFELETSQVSLKLVKKKFHENSRDQVGEERCRDCAAGPARAVGQEDGGQGGGGESRDHDGVLQQPPGGVGKRQ